MAHVQGWRKLAGSAWGPPDDPQFYGALELDAGALLEYVETIRERDGVHLTLTHLVGRAVAHALDQVPEANVRIARGKVHQREGVDVFFIVATGSGDELSGVKLCDVDKLSAVEVARELTGGVETLALGRDPAFGRAKRMLAVLPPRVLRRALRMSAWLTSDLDLDLPALGMRKESFGSAMVTSVGMWGVGQAYSPLAAYYRVPFLVCVGSVEQRARVVAGRVLARPVLTVTATFDHRYLDGFHAAKLSKALADYCAHPARFEPDLAALRASRS